MENKEKRHRTLRAEDSVGDLFSDCVEHSGASLDSQRTMGFELKGLNGIMMIF
jgi:hypothetical protein